MEEIRVLSTIDGTEQPSLFHRASGNGKRPLLVGLHTWSHNRFNQVNNLLPFAQKFHFHLLLPEFRGCNLIKNPHPTEACGSLCAKQDIVDAIVHAAKTEAVDTDNVFLLGASGGGHMALLMAGYRPDLFKAIAAFVPITDLQKWAQQNPAYRPHILACCGDDTEEMYRRSPMAYLDTIAKANLKIFHGKQDPLVPVGHSIDFFYALHAQHPHARVYLDIFDGGHELDMPSAEYWILSQYKKQTASAVTG